MGRDSGSITLREWIAVVRSTVRVLRDSDRIADIHRVAEITSRRRFAELLVRLREDEPESSMLVERPAITHDNTDLEALARLPADTLGGAYARHMLSNGLEMYVDPVPATYISDPDVRYLLHRYRQAHDIWHILLGLGTAGHEEVLVHAFILGHLGLPISALVVFFGGIKHGLLEARWSLRTTIWRAYTVGRDAVPLLTAPWESLWDQPLDQVRVRYQVRPLGATCID